MASQIIMQPDGLFAVFSSDCDGFVLYDATPEDIITAELDAYTKRVTDRINITCQQLKDGTREIKGQLTYDEALIIHTEHHGKLKEAKP